jgi:hypothetical protein
MMHTKSVFLISLAFLCFSVAWGQNPADSVLPVVKCTDFKINGVGSNSEWNKTQWVTLNQLNSHSPYFTRFKIMYSDSGIYCLYESIDSKVTATLRADNLDIFNEDVVEAFFWANEDVPVYFEYELSPLNYQLVLMVPNYDGNFLGWIPWHYYGNRMTRHAVYTKKEPVTGSVTAWYAEFYIPFELMKPMIQIPPLVGNRWRANFYRIDYDNPPGYWSWLPVKKNFHDYKLFGTIEFR